MEHVEPFKGFSLDLVTRITTQRIQQSDSRKTHTCWRFSRRWWLIRRLSERVAHYKPFEGGTKIKASVRHLTTSKPLSLWCPSDHSFFTKTLKLSHWERFIKFKVYFLNCVLSCNCVISQMQRKLFIKFCSKRS